MMLPGPVFNVELMTTARRARYYAIRAVYGLILLFFIWQNDPALHPWSYSGHSTDLSIQEMARLGWNLFGTFVAVQMVAVLLLTPAFVAGVIADEKQRKTLQYLLASRLSSGEIVLGKLAARMIHVGVFVALGLPIMSMLSLFGGVDPLWIAFAFVETICVIYFLATLSILVSTHARRPREAISLVYVLLVFWFFVPHLMAQIMPFAGPEWARFYAWIAPVNEWVAPSSPFSFASPRLWMGGSQRAFLDTVLWMMALQVGYGTLFLLVALVRLRPVARREGEGGTRWVRGWNRGRRLLPRPECGDDAMMWKERYVSRTSLATKVVAGIVVLAVGGLLAYVTYDFAKPAFVELTTYGYGTGGVTRARDDLNGLLRGLCTTIYVLWILGVASAASSGLTSEREEDTWTSLIATPLDPVDILRAKMIGAVWGTRGIALLWMVLVLTGLAAGAVHPFGFAAIVVETAIFLWFTTALGTYISLRSRRSGRALVATITILLIVNGGYTMCCIPLQPSTILIAAGVTPMIEVFSLLSYDDTLRLFRDHMWARHEPEAFLMCFIGVLTYTIAAALLTVRSFNIFDTEAERPASALRVRPSIPDAYFEVEDEESGTSDEGKEPVKTPFDDEA